MLPDLSTIVDSVVGIDISLFVESGHVAWKRGSVEFTDTVRQRGFERLLRHEQGDGYIFLHICFI